MDIFHTACVARAKVIVFISQFPLDVRKKKRKKKRTMRAKRNAKDA